MIIGDASIEVGADTRKFGRDVSRGVNGVSKKLVGLGAGLGAALGAGAIVKDVLRIGQAYEASLNTFQAVTSANAAQLDKVRAKAKALGNDLTLPGLSAAGAAEAMTELAKAGLSVDQAMSAAKGTLQLAIAGTISEGQAATVTASALNAFSLDGARAADVANLLANAANESQGEVGDFGAALQQSALVAHQAGLSIEETTGLLALFARQGLAGSDAGTSLKTAMLRLMAPMGAGAKMIEELGLSFRDANGGMKDAQGIAAELQRKLGPLSQAQRDAAMSAIFGSDAIRAGTLLYNAGAKGVEQMTAAVSKSGGAAQVAAAKSKGLVGAIDAFKSTVETTKIDIYERAAPGIEKLVRGFTGVLPGIANTILTGADAAASAIATGLATVGPPIQAGFDAALSTIRVDVIPWVTGFVSDTKAAITERAGEIFAGLTSSEGSERQGAGSTIGTAIATGIRDGLIGAIDLTGALFDKIGEQLAAVDWVGLGIAAGPAVIGLVLGLVTGIVNGITDPNLWKSIWENLPAIIIAAISIALLPAKILGPLTRILSRIPLIGPFLAWIVRALEGLGKAILGIAGTIGGSVWRGILAGLEHAGPSALVRFGRFLKALPTYVGVIALEVAERAVGMIKGLGNAIVRTAPGAVGNAIGRVIALILKAVTFFPRLLLRAGSSLIDGLVGGLASRFPTVFARLVNLTTGIKNAFKNPLGFLKGIGEDIVQGLVNGIKAAGHKVADVVRGIINKIPGPIRKIMGINSPSTVMADIGSDIGEGLAVGMLASAPAVAAAAQKLAGDVLRGVSLAEVTAAARRAMATSLDTALADRNAASASSATARAAAAAAAGPAAAAARTAAAARAKALAAARAEKAAEDAVFEARRRAGGANRAEVIELERRQRAAEAYARSTDAAADAAEKRAKDLAAKSKATNDSRLAADKALADAQIKLADEVYAAQAAAAQAAADVARAALEEVLAKATALRTGFRDAITQGAGLDDLFGARMAAASSALAGALKDQESAADATAAATGRLADAQSKYAAAVADLQAKLSSARSEEDRRRRELDAARSAEAAAQARYDAARAIATDGAAASTWELEQLRQAHTDLTDAQGRTRDAEGAYADATAAAVDAQAELADGAGARADELRAVADATAEVAAAQQAAAAAAEAYRAEQEKSKNVVVDVLGDLRTRLAQAKGFAERLGTLAGLGLNDELIAQVVAAGPELGSAMADSIINAGPAAIAEINDLTAELGRVAETGVDKIAQQLYGPGADALLAFISGMRSEFPSLSAMLAELQAMVAAALGARAQLEAAAKAPLPKLPGSTSTSTGPIFAPSGPMQNVDASTTFIVQGNVDAPVARQLEAAADARAREVVRLVKAGVRR